MLGSNTCRYWCIFPGDKYWLSQSLCLGKTGIALAGDTNRNRYCDNIQPFQNEIPGSTRAAYICPDFCLCWCF